MSDLAEVPTKKRTVRPLFWTDERLREAYAVYIKRGWNLVRTCQSFGSAATDSMRMGFHRLGLPMRPLGRPLIRVRQKRRGPAIPRESSPLVRAQGHPRIVANGACVVCDGREACA